MSFERALVFATYAGGLLEDKTGNSGSRSTIELYLYDQSSGFLAKSATGQTICGPCTFNLSTGVNRMKTIKIQDLFDNAGGFITPLFTGFAVINISGDENVHLGGFISNSKTSPFDLSVFGFEPVELKAVP